MLRSAASSLGRVEASLAEHAGGTGSIERDVHEASELDEEAAADVKSGDLSDAASKI